MSSARLLAPLALLALGATASGCAEPAATGCTTDSDCVYLATCIAGVCTLVPGDGGDRIDARTLSGGPVQNVGGGSSSDDDGDAGTAVPRDASYTTYDPELDDECPILTIEAEGSVENLDVLWVIDNSGSMLEEIDLVQTNLDAFLSRVTLRSSGTHLILVTHGDYIDEPSGSGIRFVNWNVGSWDAPAVILDSYSEWSDFIRGEDLEIIVTTDDESEYSADYFQSYFAALYDGRYRFHAIASPPGEEPCRGSYGSAMAAGEVYAELAERTGGSTYSICEDDWTDLARDIADAVGEPLGLPCSVVVPNSVLSVPATVVYREGGTGAETIAALSSEGDCGSDPGWFYSDSGTVIRFCADFCEDLTEDASGVLEIGFDCDPIQPDADGDSDESTDEAVI